MRGGGQTYLKNLIKHYPNYSDVKVIALVPRKFATESLDITALEILCSDFADKGVLARIFWTKFILPKIMSKLKVDVLYSVSGSLANRSPKIYRTVVTFQNMLPFADDERGRYPLGYMRFRLWLLKFIQGASFREANLVIFISLFAKSVIDLYLPFRKGRSVIIPHGVSEYFFEPCSRPVHPRLPREYVLYVSILDVYKSQIEVVKAWAELRLKRSTHEKLILVGPEFKYYGDKVRKLISELGLENEVFVLGNVSHNELPAYYQHAKVNIFASSCENCPSILLEALAGGRPVICSDYQPMPELGLDSVLYFDPYNPQQLTEKLLLLLEDPVLQADMGRRARIRAHDFSWDVSARLTWESLYAEACKAK